MSVGRLVGIETHHSAYSVPAPQLRCFCQFSRLYVFQSEKRNHNLTKNTLRSANEAKKYDMAERRQTTLKSDHHRFSGAGCVWCLSTLASRRNTTAAKSLEKGDELKAALAQIRDNLTRQTQILPKQQQPSFKNSKHDSRKQVVAVPSDIPSNYQ